MSSQDAHRSCLFGWTLGRIALFALSLYHLALLLSRAVRILAPQLCLLALTPHLYWE